MSRLIFFYTFFLVLVTLFSYLFIDQNLTYLKVFYTGFVNNHRFLTSLTFFLIIITFFIFYVLFLKKARKGILDLKKVIIVTFLILFFSYPAMLSYDIFNYVTTSKIVFGYHENPYIFTPVQFTGEPFLQFTRATNKIALYGPFWILVSGIPYIFGFGNFLVTLFGFKMIAAIFYLAISLLIFKITKNTLSTAIFALNPLVIIESLVSGHNDIFMMFFALLSFYFLSKNKRMKGSIFLLLSIFIKYATVFLIPVFVYELLKTIKNKVLNLRTIYFAASISMILIFFLSALREEIYPWYGIWFLTFVSTIPNRRFLLYFSFGLCVGLLLSYLPYMFFGTYAGITPYIKNILIFLPVFISIVVGLKRRVWLKNFFWQ